VGFYPHQEIMAVTKLDIIKSVSKDTGISPEAVSSVLGEFLDSVKECLVQRKTIEIRGFGTFIPKYRKPRPARNPKMPDQVVMLPNRVVPVIKFSSQLKSKLNQAVKQQA